MEWENVFAAGAQVSLVSDLLRILSFGLDASLFGLAGLTFNLIYKLYDFSSFIDTSAILSTMQKSIYSLLSIFMFFKLGFSLLGMLVNPDMVENKEKGAGKLVSGVAVCLVLIAIMPMVFDYAMMVQTKVMEGQLIEKAMYGEAFSSGNTRELGESKNFTLGTRLALSTWKVFMQPTVEKGEAVTAYDDVFEEIESRDGLWYSGDLFLHLNDTTALGFFSRIPGIALLTNLFGGGVRYQLSYIIILSTAAAIFLIWTLLKLSIDVAYRSIKMFALQMLAPIAIITYIDPKSSKDGVFAKWVKEAVKTYTSLFVRVFVFAFVSVLLMELDFTKLNGGPIIMLMYILAIIAFIKAAPKFIDNILGTEISKDQDTKLASDILRGGFGAIGGAALGLGAAAVMGKGLPPKAFAKAMTKGGWQGATKGYDAAKKGGLRGVVDAYTGTYSGIKKSLGYEAADKDYEREVANMYPYVKKGKDAKGEAVKAMTKSVIAEKFGKERDINGYKFNLNAGLNDAEVLGAQNKYESIKAENAVIPGISSVGNEKYAYAAFMKKEAKQISVIKGNAEKDYTRRITYTSDADKEAEVIAEFNELRSSGKTTATKWTELYETEDVSTAFKKKVNSDIKKSTGLGVDEWANVSEKADSDAKGAEDAVAEHEKTTVGIKDKRAREVYNKAKGKYDSENWDSKKTW